MKRIVEIVPARPGWYARWRIGPDDTRSYPVTLWALLEHHDGSGREVVGVDCVGQWPGADDDDMSGDFVRYLFQTPDSGAPEDVESPLAGQSRDEAPHRQAAPAA
ncbi:MULTISPECIES: hypothetical protein [Micromonospora]|uniref:Uncharacterized protein n=1 Tax=Micromonospora tulbaghiae TaxID=479978 RepID=A0A386WKF2_9ACTN|nr:hypothetical protein [Micromonospora tulbaghiae]AYF27950.1 hypothetical protein CSH63_10950 [Micromonospora tulbaghiae]